MINDVLENALWHVLEVLASAMLLLLLSLLRSEINPVLGCLALVSAVVLGAAQRALWTALILSIAVATLNLAMLSTRWRSVGVLDLEMTIAVSHLLAILGLICGGGWGVGRCISWVVRGGAAFRR